MKLVLIKGVGFLKGEGLFYQKGENGKSKEGRGIKMQDFLSGLIADAISEELWDDGGELAELFARENSGRQPDCSDFALDYGADGAIAVRMGGKRYLITVEELE